jgi:hypothetical protein
MPADESTLLNYRKKKNLVKAAANQYRRAARTRRDSMFTSSDRPDLRQVDDRRRSAGTQTSSRTVSR